MPFGPLGGSITFSPGMMAFDTTGADDFPGATKPLPASLSTVLGISGQFSFTEYQTPPDPTTTYEIVVNNAALSETVLIALFGDGSIFVQVGDPASTPSYAGAWTPNGGSHEIHFSVDLAGVPTLFIDGVEVVLAFFGDVPSGAASLPANSVALFLGAGSATPASSSVTSVFVTSGATPPATDFCCPA